MVQTIPAYLELRDKFGIDEIDVIYLKVREGESVTFADVFPCEKIREITPQELVILKKDYEYQFKPWYLSSEGEFIKEAMDSFSEHYSEVKNNLKVIECLGTSLEVKKEFRSNEMMLNSVHSPSNYLKGYITVHNGGLNLQAWRVKKYPMWGRLIEKIKTLELPIVCLGKEEEYIPGTQNKTGLNLQDTMTWINHSKCHISTDTSTMHMAALADTPGVGIFTCTSWDMKNWDEDFHKGITVVHPEISCSPCQKGYHWSPERNICQQGRMFYPCQNIQPEIIFKEIKEKLNG